MTKSPTGSGNKPAAKGSPNGSPKDSPRPSPSRLESILQLSTAPAPIQRAVKVMVAGAAATLVWGLFGVVVNLAFRTDAVNNIVKTSHVSVSNATAQVNGIVLWDVIVAVVCAGIWILMARMNRNGRSWARIASSVLFLIWTYEVYQSINGLRGAASPAIGIGAILLGLLIWGCGAGALYYLWRPESTAFFKTAERL
jgi:hypothetical protein